MDQYLDRYLKYVNNAIKELIKAREQGVINDDQRLVKRVDRAIEILTYGS